MHTIDKGKWIEWRDAPERTDSSGLNGPVDEQQQGMILTSEVCCE
jgi:hypothetical protein